MEIEEGKSLEISPEKIENIKKSKKIYSFGDGYLGIKRENASAKKLYYNGKCSKINFFF
jgi:hypothetical protein